MSLLVPVDRCRRAMRPDQVADDFSREVEQDGRELIEIGVAQRSALLEDDATVIFFVVKGWSGEIAFHRFDLLGSSDEYYAGLRVGRSEFRETRAQVRGSLRLVQIVENAHLRAVLRFAADRFGAG
jgi:hypothetical protein